MNNEESKLIIDYYDKSKHGEKANPPNFVISYEKLTIFAYTPAQLIDYTSSFLLIKSNPALSNFKKIKLENKLIRSDFSKTNDSIKNIVQIHNNIEKQLKKFVKKKIKRDKN